MAPRSDSELPLPLSHLVILNPPHILQAAHDPSDPLPSSESPESVIESELELLPRSWWIPNEDKTMYRGIKDTMAYIHDFLEKREAPFDGVLGFSQGAAAAAIIIALLEQGSQYAGSKPNHPPLRFGIFVSGFKPLDVELSPLFERPITTHTLHILGKTDVIVSTARSQSLVNACDSPRLEWHEGGHHIPGKASWRTFFKAYILSFDPSSMISHTEVPSPSLSIPTASQPPSGTNSGVVTPAG